MRPRSLAFLILLLCAGASAATVVVEAPVIRLTRTLDSLHLICGADGAFDACTRFIGYRLEANCAPRGASWRIDARATFRPWILLYNIRQLPHEGMHIADIRESAERYVASLEEMEFASAAGCTAAALGANRLFEQTMLEFARRSTVLRHPHLARPPSSGADPVLTDDYAPVDTLLRRRK